MRLRDTVCLVFVAALFVGCKGQAFTFNVTTTISGQNITVGIAETSGTATFECQLDSGAFQPCFDGFVYISVPIGDRSITVRGTSVDNQTSTVTVSPVRVSADLTVTATVSGDGTVITVIIDANQDATFECQLDNTSFIPCFSGFQYRGVSAGLHTVRVRATSNDTGVVALSTIGTVNIDEIAIQFEGITGTQNISAQTYTFEFTPTEDFPVQCSIDGGEFVDCTSPYVIDTSSLSRGEHNITFRIVIDGVVRGLATETFTVLEEVFIEFRDAAYSVVEDDRVYTFTVVRQGEPGEDILVSIFPSPDSRPGAVDPVEFPSDFTQGGQVTFTPGGPSEITSQLLVRNDTSLEANETILLALSLNPAAMESGARLGARNQSIVTVINDDVVEVMFQQQLVEADETTLARFSVTFSPQDTEIPFTFIVETVDLSPPDAEAGIDYVPLRTNVTLGPLQATQNLAVNIIEDSLTERTEEFEVRIIVPEEAQQLGVSPGMPSVLTVRIIDDDPGDPEIECSTNVTGDELTGRTIRLTFSANQDDVTFRCRLNNEAFMSCMSPVVFMNVDFFETVTVTLEATTLLFDTATVTKPVFFAMGGLQVVGAGAIAVDLAATKNATYRCRLNDGEFVDCVDQQEFSNLAAGTYTLFIEATATDGSGDVAFDTVGPVLLTAGANATISEAIAACFGRAELRCDNVTCQYAATWRSRGDMVEFSLVARTQGWVGIGFSTNRIMPRSDIIVGAADNEVLFFVDDRYATDRAQPPRDVIQNVNDGSASFVDGITTVEFSRDKVTGDSEDDLSLNVCRYLLYAWSGDANINTGVIQFHGTQNQGVSDTLLCFPSSSLCPERFNCGDPGTPADGSRNLTDTLEGSIVTYICNTGFELVGNSSQICELTAEGPRWSFTRPECVGTSCGDPGTPINGGTIVSNFSIGSTAVHFCNEGFILDGVSQRTCIGNGTWSDSLPTCVIVDCNAPGRPTNGNTMGTLINITSTDVVVLALSTTFGSVVNHTCNEGYRLIGASVRECLANGNWSEPLPNCELIDCGNLLAPDNGDIMITTTTVESIANYTCNTGFRLDGVDQRVCLPNGTWSDDAPSCNIIDCGDAGTPANGDTMQTNTTFGSIVNHTCNEGFNLTGEDQRECLETGNWSAPLPMCVIIDCGDAGTPGNGTTMQTTTTFGSIVNHTCNEGFNLIGASQRICLATGMWSDPLPTCMIVNCGSPGTPMNGNTIVESTTFGSVVTHTCNTGFALNGTNRRECLASGSWSDPLPSCILSNCGDPGIPGNGSTIAESFTFGSTINHTCNEGFELIGVSQRICLENSSWSDSLPTCEIIDCGDAGTPANGTTMQTTTTFGSIVNHTCNEGFNLIGASQRICLATGMWSDPLPTCMIVSCGSPGTPMNGNTIVESTTFGSVVTHTCNTGFALNGTNRRECLASGSWSDPLPSCILSNCGDPGTPGNGSTIAESFTFGSTINHTCNEGFELIGVSQRICLENSSWSDSLPTCEIIDCGDAGIPDNGTTIGTSTTFGSIVNHACNEGFLLVGANQRECLQSASWSEPLPVCNEVNCGDPGIPANGSTVVSSTTLNAVALHTCNDGFVLVGESERVCLENAEWSAPLPSCEESRICRINGTSIFPYSQTGRRISYLLRDVCEHTVLTTCTGSERFSVNIDYSEESLNLARVGVQYNTTTIIVITDDNGLSLISENLGNNISQSGQTTEYPNQIFITEASNEIIIDIRRLGIRLNVSSSGLQVEVTSGALSGDVCGLCGRLNGELLYSDRTSVADITDRVDVQQFTNSWRADDEFLRDVPRNICSSTVKIGDPIFKIPIHFDQALIDQNPALAEACLCYEVHGRDNSTFNLLSDRCTSVNAQYTSMANPVAGNFISAIGVTVIDRDGVCHEIEANIDQCSVTVDGNPLDIGGTFSNAGITVMRFQGRVKIVVPNCGRVEVVLWFICKAVHNTVMSEFIIARGVTLQPTSHGLVGQFWNIPIGVDEFAVNSSVMPFYAVTVNAPNRAPRSFVGSLFERPWEIMLPCLFSGNRQGGATNAFGDPNDSVIQGSIGDYEVDDLFDNDFVFSTFDSAACAKKK